MASATFKLPHIMAIGSYCCNKTAFPHEFITASPTKNSTFKAILKSLLTQTVSQYLETENVLKKDETKSLSYNNTDSDYLLDNKN